MSERPLTTNELRDLVLGVMQSSNHTCQYCGYQFYPDGDGPTLSQAICHVSCLGTDGMKSHHASMLLEQVS